MNTPPVQITDEQAKAILADPMATLVRWCDSGEYESFCALVTELLAAREGWQPIETAPKDRTAVIIAVPNRDQTGFGIGEAYFDPENYEGGDWWWAGTGWGDYHGGPISEVNHHPPAFWRPLPTPPAIKETTNAA